MRWPGKAKSAVSAVRHHCEDHARPNRTDLYVLPLEPGPSASRLVFAIDAEIALRAAIVKRVVGWISADGCLCVLELYHGAFCNAGPAVSGSSSPMRPNTERQSQECGSAIKQL